MEKTNAVSKERTRPRDSPEEKLVSISENHLLSEKEDQGGTKHVSHDNEKKRKRLASNEKSA